jgi:hypothetical protein
MVHEACDEAASLIARYFLDSSALVKRYHRESGSPDVDQLLAAPDNQIIISRLALVELHSSFARLVRENVLSESDINKVVSRLEADVASGLLNVVAVSSSRLGTPKRTPQSRRRRILRFDVYQAAIRVGTAEKKGRRRNMVGGTFFRSMSNTVAIERRGDAG